jgi:hypothetical protein
MNLHANSRGVDRGAKGKTEMRGSMGQAWHSKKSISKANNENQKRELTDRVRDADIGVLKKWMLKLQYMPKSPDQSSTSTYSNIQVKPHPSQTSLLCIFFLGHFHKFFLFYLFFPFAHTCFQVLLPFLLLPPACCMHPASVSMSPSSVVSVSFFFPSFTFFC